MDLGVCWHLARGIALIMSIFASVPKVHRFISSFFYWLRPCGNMILHFHILRFIGSSSQSILCSPLPFCKAPADPILGLVGRFKADPSEKKAWLMVFLLALLLTKHD